MDRRAPTATGGAAAAPPTTGTDPDANGAGALHAREASLSAAELERIGTLVAGSISASTARAYASDWSRWENWCVRRGSPARPIDPLLVAGYLQEAATARTPTDQPAYAPATMSRWVASLNRAARAVGQTEPGRNPVVAAVLAGIRRTTTRETHRRDPLLLEGLQAICEVLQQQAREGTRGVAVAAIRDRAIITMGFFGGFRRSELAALTLRDATWHGTSEGVRARVARSKTDPDGHGLVKALPPRNPQAICPVCAVLAWAKIATSWDRDGRVGVIRTLHTPAPAGQNGHACTELTDQHARELLPATDAPLFRSLHRSGTLRGPLTGAAINQLIRRRAAAAGLDASDLGGHSLRAGLVTEAYRAGATPESIAQQTGHTSLRVLATYRREHAPLTGNAVLQVADPLPTPAADPDDTGGLNDPAGP